MLEIWQLIKLIFIGMNNKYNTVWGMRIQHFLKNYDMTWGYEN